MNKIIHGDSFEKLKELEENSVDCIVTDPPYGYSFMGKDWDNFKATRTTKSQTVTNLGAGMKKTSQKENINYQHWVTEWAAECLRVAKPGAFMFYCMAPRADLLSRAMIGLEEAGWNISFTPIYWTYASGFPKAMNIGKMVDKRLGGAISNEAKALEGSYGGFQPKPAVEVIIVAMKPLSEKTYVDQALKNGEGITWLDDCRIPAESTVGWSGGGRNADASTSGASRGGVQGGFNYNNGEPRPQNGRFPANLLVSDCVLDGEQEYSRYFDLDKWANTLPFLIVPKASKSEKNKGLEAFDEIIISDREAVENIGANNPRNRTGTAKKNHHPTVKPLKLMSYLITLGSREGDTILDPFTGSGTTCIAAKKLKRNYIGIEREVEYVQIAEARISAVPNTLI
jgi:DNA modification methylase